MWRIINRAGIEGFSIYVIVRFVIRQSSVTENEYDKYKSGRVGLVIHPPLTDNETLVYIDTGYGSKKSQN